MISLWLKNNQNDEAKGRSKKDKESFREHDEIMKKFRIAHTEHESKTTAPKNFIKTSSNRLAPVDPNKPENNR